MVQTHTHTTPQGTSCQTYNPHICYRNARNGLFSLVKIQIWKVRLNCVACEVSSEPPPLSTTKPGAMGRATGAQELPPRLVTLQQAAEEAAQGREAPTRPRAGLSRGGRRGHAAQPRTELPRPPPGSGGASPLPQRLGANRQRRAQRRAAEPRRASSPRQTRAPGSNPPRPCRPPCPASRIPGQCPPRPQASPRHSRPPRDARGCSPSRCGQGTAEAAGARARPAALPYLSR